MRRMASVGREATAIRRSPKTRLLCVLSCLLLVFVAALPIQFVIPPAQAEAGPRTKRVLIVSANVNEFRKKDSRYPLDTRYFVTRLLRKTPATPDAILLQEVNHRAVRRIKRFLSHDTDIWWKVAVDAPRTPFRRTGPRELTGTDTAIIINGRTTREVRPGGFIATGYSAREAHSGHMIKRKRHAFTLLRREGSGFDLGVVSIHYPKPPVFRNRRTSNRLKARWNRKVNHQIRSSYPRAKKVRRIVVAGDFNSRRCRGQYKYVCPLSAPYSVMDDAGYKESVLQMERAWNFIDFIFTTASTSDADFDEKRYSTQKPRYSDHRLRWALLELKDQTPPSPVYTWPREYPKRVHVHTGPKSVDGGSGVRHYSFERSATGRAGPFDEIGTAEIRNFDDYTAQDHATYWYRVTVVDRAGNVSRFKNVARIDT
jgi:endonuclease/exonuclease/phosphatase family metal-dependent hydrolase